MAGFIVSLLFTLAALYLGLVLAYALVPKRKDRS